MRIAWVSPMTPASGVGSFSHAVTRCFPASIDGEAIDLTIIHPPHKRLHRSRHRMIPIGKVADFAPLLGLFDVVIYNIGNNNEHHGAIFELLANHPGVVISHDYVYQHYLAGRSLLGGRGFGSYAALLARYGSDDAGDDLRRSRITSRDGEIRYSPWDSEYSARQPVGNLLFDLASALVTHSVFAESYAKRRFRGPVLRLGMPCGQKRAWDDGGTRDDAGADAAAAWRRELSAKRVFHLVSFGHIQSSKALDLMIEAIGAEPSLRGRLRYTVAGFVSCESTFGQLRDLVAAHDLGEVVRFETGVSERRLAQLMDAADVFINLRRPNTEASSASLVEQLETGRPVVILDSGCYAELPPEAACKLPADATAADLGRALVALLDDPAAMAAIGAAGQRHARSWSCAGYAEALSRFALRHRDLLRESARAIGACPLVQAGDRRAAPPAGDWGRNLVEARRTFAYLERGVLALDPAIVMGLSREALCRYVAETIFGLFGDATLLRVLARYFAGRSDRAAYWSCARFALIADAVLSGDSAARARLRASEPVLDLEFWRVIECLGARAFLATTLILLGDSMPEGDERLVSEDDANDGFPTRLRVLERLRDNRCWQEEGAQPLRSWLEQPGFLPPDGDLPILNGDVDWAAGGSLFCTGVDLSGFYAMEADHVWSRGTRAFIGLRPGPDVVRVELLLRPIDADLQTPCRIGVALDGEGSSLQLRATTPVWLGLDLPHRIAGPIDTCWLSLSTERASPPPNSTDPRPLGLCLLRLRLLTSRIARIPLAREERPRREELGETLSTVA